MIKPLSILLAIGISAAIGQTAAIDSIQNHPRMGVVIVVDQMRADYVTRFAPFFTGGLKRILTEGAVFDSASHEHANTETAVGHATLSTGCFPMHHGIVGNEFYDRAHDTIVYAVEDTMTRVIRTTSAALKHDDSLGSSAQYLMRPGIGNWFKSSGRGRLFSVALKDRSAILMAGQTTSDSKKPDGVYWWDRKTGDFVTSTAYAQALPDWINRFNSGQLRDSWRNATWDRFLDSADHKFYDLIGADNVAEENDGIHTTFPHAFLTERPNRKYFDALYPTPFADQLLIRFVRELIANEKVGQVEGQDLLIFSCSAADAVGHAYGPNSHEIFDYYLRLDKYLDTLLQTLDSAVGRDNYIVALSADHGCAELAVGERRLAFKDYTLAVEQAVKVAALNSLLDFRSGSLVEFLGSDLIIRRKRLATIDADSVATFAGSLTRELMGLRYVSVACTDTMIADSTGGAAEVIRLLRNNAYVDRLPDITVVLKEEAYLSSATGTGHGSPYWYDRHVPLVFWGQGIKPQHWSGRVRTVDMAPTIAELLGISPSDSIDGRSLVNMIRR